ncbi:MAG: OmpH family outer membrane protein [Chlorobi bacterium]|nr:OmpH family outer membrane protein [Chlorobiota bacterium]
MKKLVTIIFALSVALSGSVLHAQNLKFGHINSSELLQAMPENDSAQAQLQHYAKQLQDQLQTMQTEYNTKLQDYLGQQDNLTDLIKKTKEEELQQLQQRIQDFQSTAQQDMQKKQNDLLTPIINKANEAIKAVARENGFIYIFDISRGTILYYSDKSQDILPLVKKKLGIQ